MNWIKFIENHDSDIRLPRIGRSIYSNSSNSSRHSTLINFYRETEKIIHY